MNKNNDNGVRSGHFSGTGIALILVALLFYLPSAFFFFEKSGPHRSAWFMDVIMASIYTASFFLNYLWLVPGILLRSERKILFFALNLIFITVAVAMVPLWSLSHEGLRPPGAPPIDSVSRFLIVYARFLVRDGIMMILAAGLAYALRLAQEKDNLQKKELQLSAERRNIELRSLKAQLNPHFLFNTLNNIYALIAIAPDKAQSALHKLSSMLRFMIYSASASAVPLAKELEFIDDYVELMRLRLGSSCRLEFSTISDPDSSLKIAPLLYLTIVENAFKHSAPGPEGHFIRISIFLTFDALVCRVVNSIAPGSNEDAYEESSAGVGLANVRRQLNLIYPGHASFITHVKSATYTAEISISLEMLRHPIPEKENIS